MISSRIPFILRKHFKRNEFGFIYASVNQHFSTVTVPNAQSASESIQISRYLQPLMNRPIDEILSHVDEQSISSADSVAILKALRMNVLFKGVSTESIKSDEKFNILCKIFENNCRSMAPNLLLSGLRSLLEVGEPTDAPWVIKAEESVIERMDSFSVFNLIGSLYCHRKFSDTSLQKTLVSLLAKEVHRRIDEVSSSSEVLMLVQILRMFDIEKRKRIKMKIAELLPVLNVHEICKIFTLLAEKSNRSTVILNPASFQLRQKREALEVKETVDLLYAFRTLNFIDQSTFSALFHDLLPKIPTINQPSVISALLTICGSLRYKHPDFLDVCGKWILHHISSCRPRELTTYILTLASLNYLTTETEKRLQSVLQHLTPEKVESPVVWLDVIWSLAIHNMTDKKMLQDVLSSKFYKPLIDGSDFRANCHKLKLMNLKGVLKVTYPECIFGCDLFLEPVEMAESTEVINSRRHVIKVLSNFIPYDKYLCSNINTDTGILIDAEFIVDKHSKPVSLMDYGIKAKGTHAKSLPKGSHRIALLILFPKDYNLYSVSLTGSNALAVRLLSAQGYTVVKIPFSEFIVNATEVKKAAYLLNKIKDAVKSKSTS